MRMRHYRFLPIVNLRLAQRYCPRLVSLAGPSASPLALGFAFSRPADSEIGIFRMAVRILKLRGTLTTIERGLAAWAWWQCGVGLWLGLETPATGTVVFSHESARKCADENRTSYWQ